ncbi:MAG: DUF4388 domain-containing protein [Deltaproteobacteria bacterium]|nr:MAG: DUF4388 domain-containing protein [Deltaproteobacteria bacterium]
MIDIMQYIHASQKSGILHFQNWKEVGQVYFQDGHIVRATRPKMINIGDLLLERGQITREDLKEAVRIQKNMPQAKPLGRIMEEKGIITHKTLRDTMIQQIGGVIYELISWEEGSFHFELEDHMFLDDISVSPDDVVPPEEIDTQSLLLEAVRIFDEMKNQGKDAREVLETFNALAPELDAETTFGEEKEGITLPTAGFDDPAQSFSLLKKMLLAGRKNGQAQSISVHFLKILSEHMERAILFLARRSELLGLGGVGQTTDHRSLNNKVKNMRIPLETDSLLLNCIESRSLFSGIPPSQNWLKDIYRVIGPPEMPEVLLLPIAGVERVSCLVYGDNGSLAKPPCHLEFLEIAAGQAGLIFENTFLRKHLQRKSY